MDGPWGHLTLLPLAIEGFFEVFDGLAQPTHVVTKVVDVVVEVFVVLLEGYDGRGLGLKACPVPAVADTEGQESHDDHYDPRDGDSDST